ncbi:glycosyltransferase family 61 protein [Mucilaginibacter yixingensis]|uniref:glycosyltransferase family 61 protein n=1 Tax=Mucilaginibacter yixingensis TaxID=1295612 RepID=UPI0034E2E717
MPKPTRLTGLTLSCLTVGADGGFYHFFYEAITKLYIYQPFISQAQQIIFNGPVTNWKLKWLQLAKVDSSKVIWMENQGHYVAEQLLFTNRLVADQQINPWSIYALRSLFNVPVACSFTHPSGILWLTRKNVQARNIVWEDKLLSLFPAINSVVLEDMSIEQTIAMFRSAQIVIAPHGASLSNILFCNTGTKVLELYDKGTYFQPCYFRLSELCKLRHEIAYLNFNNADDEVYGLTLAKKLITNLLQNA